MRISIVFVLIVLCGCQRGKDQTASQFTEEVSPFYKSENKPFYHGVASGDPLADRVIIWTRVTPADSLPTVDVAWEVSRNENFQPVLKQGAITTSPDFDYTVKVDVDGLDPDTRYYYRFKAFDKISPVGKTRTLPDGDIDTLKFAVVSCSNWQHGYFNAYDRIAEKDFDIVLHLGDYIYEYGVDRVKVADRRHLPSHEIITLSDYRTRYSQYHLDEGLRKVRQNFPLITIWDDHEVANNTYMAGAQNHQPEEGDFSTRKAAARKAYYEWIPIREGEKHYRSFAFGNLAELIMLDERQEGKSAPAKGVNDPTYASSDRSMLGAEQLAWFEDKLDSSTATWKIIGNQVLFSDFDRSAQTPASPRNMDSWDGYPAEKQRIADYIRQNKLRNIIFLTGDTHSSWAFEVMADPLKKLADGNGKPIAVEFGTPSVSSSNSNESMPDDSVMMFEQGFLKTNPHLKFVNRRDHGYVALTLTSKGAKADWYYVGSIIRPDATETMARSFTLDLNSTTLK